MDDVADRVRHLRPVTGEEDKYSEFAPKFERALVYACCSSPRVWEMVGVHLRPEAMRDPRSAALLKAAAEIARETGEGPSSPTVVVQRLCAVRDEGRLKQASLDKICGLLDEVEDDDPQLARPDHLIAEAARVVRARMTAATVQAIQVAHGKGDPLGRLAVQLESIERVGRDPATAAVMLGSGAWAAIERLRRADRLPTGIVQVDDALAGGLFAKTLSVWGAPANVGKTAAMVHQCCFNWLLGKRVIYVPMEEDVGSTLIRAIAFITGCTMDEVGATDGAAVERLERMTALPNVGSLAVEYLPQGSSPAQLQRLIDGVLKDHPEFDGEWDAVFVDYPDKMHPRQTAKNTYEKMGFVYDDLRKIAVDAGKWMVVGSQLKDYEGEPTIEDLRDSRMKGDIADAGILMWRPDDDDDERMYKIAKNRGPGAGQVLGPVPTELERGRIAPVGASELLEDDGGW